MSQQNHELNPEKNSNFSVKAKILEGAMDFGVKITQILERDARYDIEAYSFIMSALQHILNKIDEHRHISGKEFLEGVRDYAIHQYGPMSRLVLEHWGIKNTMDIGEIVFNLVETGLLKRRPEDSKEEFRDVYDFRTAFDKPYKRSFSPRTRLNSKKK